MSLFTPLASLGLKNRAVMAPMTRYSCTPDGSPTPEVAEYYLKRARHSVGLIIIESCAVNATDAVGYRNGAQFHTQSHADAWKPIVEQLHQAGSKVWLQLFHTGRLTVEEICQCQPLAPSALPTFDGSSFWRPEVDGKVVHFQTNTAYKTPAEISCVQIEEVTQQFAEACRLAEQSGFDGVELHGAHGYLLHEFCHRETNNRTDDYGPSPNFRFPIDVARASRAAVSPTFTLCYRLSLHMVDNPYVRYAKEDFDHALLVEQLDQAGVDVFHSSEMKAGTRMFGGETSLHQMVSEHTKKPVLVCGAVHSLEEANMLLEGEADLVAFGRGLISNPEMISNFEKGIDFEFVKFDYAQHMTDVR